MTAAAYAAGFDLMMASAVSNAVGRVDDEDEGVVEVNEDEEEDSDDDDVYDEGWSDAAFWSEYRNDGDGDSPSGFLMFDDRESCFETSPEEFRLWLRLLWSLLWLLMVWGLDVGDLGAWCELIFDELLLWLLFIS